MEFNVETVLSLLSPVLIALLTWATTMLKKLIDTKTAELKAKNTNATLMTYIDLLKDITTNVIVSLNSSVVDDLKKASSDGKLTIEEAEEIKNKAIKKIVAQLSDDVVATLTIGVGDLNEYISNLIDKRVEDVKAINTK